MRCGAEALRAEIAQGAVTERIAIAARAELAARRAAHTPTIDQHPLEVQAGEQWLDRLDAAIAAAIPTEAA